MLCDDLGDRMVVAWREAQEGGLICIPIADSLYVQQKLTQNCKAIICQLKMLIFFKIKISLS